MFTKRNFPNFYRIVPNVRYLDVARVEFVKLHGWKRVGTLCQDDPRYTLVRAACGQWASPLPGSAQCTTPQGRDKAPGDFGGGACWVRGRLVVMGYMGWVPKGMLYAGVWSVVGHRARNQKLSGSM